MPSSFALTKGALAISFALALTPGVFAAGPWVESRLFPVTTPAQIIEAIPDATGVAFFVQFRKRRQCEFLGLAWYDGDMRVPVEFEPTGGIRVPMTRPVGGQLAGPWHLEGVETLAGTQAWALHRCHPLWITFTEFYRG